MLDAFIIEELRRREERERGDDRPRLELPLEDRRERLPRKPREDETGETPTPRGVIIIDF